MSDFDEKNENPHNSHWIGSNSVSYAKIPIKIFELRTFYGLTSSECWLAVCLANACHNSKNGSFSISILEMRKISGLSNGSVNTAILKLIEVGLIKQRLQLSPSSKNFYKWNLEMLKAKKPRDNLQNLERGLSKNWKRTSPKSGDGGFQILDTVYIQYFLYILYISFIDFFAETDEHGRPASFTFRALPSRGDNMVGEDSPMKPKTKKVPRLDAWRYAIQSVLDSGISNPYIKIYSVIMKSGDVPSIRFPHRYLKVELADANKIQKYKKDEGHPAWCESDELFFEYLKTQFLFGDFKLKSKKGEPWMF